MKFTGGVYWEAIKGDMAGWSLMPGEPRAFPDGSFGSDHVGDQLRHTSGLAATRR